MLSRVLGRRWGSPLLVIERAVQERAKALALDMARPAGKDALRALLDDEVRRWAADVKGGRPARRPGRPGMARVRDDDRVTASG